MQVDGFFGPSRGSMCDRPDGSGRAPAARVRRWRSGIRCIRPACGNTVSQHQVGIGVGWSRSISLLYRGVNPWAAPLSGTSMRKDRAGTDPELPDRSEER
ncbi:hypothetical protein GCM10010519_43330 [Streptomyces lactacystinicus]